METIEQEPDTQWREVEAIDISLEMPVPYYLCYDKTNALAKKIRENHFDKVFVFSCNSVENIYGAELKKALHDRNVPYEFRIINDKEHEKCFSNLNNICEYLIENDVSRDSILLAFGGGVVGNIVGLAAALIFRGIRYIEVPTTFMSQTDSTLSNKQGINGNNGKNQFGTYYAPLFVWSDIKYLKTEGAHNRRSGLVEAIKNGLISDKEYLQNLEVILKRGIGVSDRGLHNIVKSAILSKVKILKKDPSEKSYAIVLEYGHTFGHALEWLSKGQLNHGEAVAIGMCMAAELSSQLNILSSEEHFYHYSILRDVLEMPMEVPAHITTDDILKTIRSDNKKKARGVKYVLLDRHGSVHNPDGDFMVSVEENRVRRVLNNFVGKNKSMSSFDQEQVAIS